MKKLSILHSGKRQCRYDTGKSSMFLFSDNYKILFLILGFNCCSILSYAQSGRNYYDIKTVAAAREKVDKYDWAIAQKQKLKKRVSWIMQMSDQELWDFVPPVTQRRALNVSFNVGCPQHGKEVYRHGGHYPWIMSRELPFKVKCPVGGEIYPTNDFVPWHNDNKEGQVDTTEEYFDDGNGYIGPDGQRYHFVAHYIFRQHWRNDIFSSLDALRDLYLLTNDKRYARVAAILLARIAADYPQASYARQAVHRQEPPHGIHGGILDYIWENAGVIKPCATAFDAVAPALDDPEVVNFIWDKGIKDVRRHVEDNLFFEMVRRISGGRGKEKEDYIWGNFGMYQKSMAILAVVLKNKDPERGLTSLEMIDWIMRPGIWYEVGAIQEALWNRFYRDGHGGESSPSYSAKWTAGITSIAQILQKLDYDLFQHPKMSRLVNVGLDMSVLGKWTPSIGDAGDIFGSKHVGWYRNILLPAYKAVNEPKWARAMELTGIKDDQLWESVPVDQIKEDAEAYGGWPTGGTKLLGGYGLAIAESPSAPVGLGLYYGYAGGGHGHRDRLTIEMFALDKPVLTEHGYPTPLGNFKTTPKRFYWTSNTIGQYGVTVNRKWQQTYDRGNLELLASTPNLQAIDASAEKVAYPEETSLYRRTSLLIENPEGLPYLFDIFRVDGGWEHVWSFHGPPFEQFQTFGLNLGPVQENGTLAGEDIAFGEEPKDPATPITSGFQFLFNVQKAPPPASSWGAVWSNSKDSSYLRMTALPTAITSVVVADSEPELKPNHPETMPNILAFNSKQKDSVTRSDFVAVVEPYRKDATLGKMERLKTEGAEHSVAAIIDGENGKQFIVSHLSPDDHSIIHYSGAGNKEFEVKGEIAYISTEKDGMSKVSLVNFHHLTSPWLSIEADEELEGKIIKADYHRNLIILDQLIEGAEALVGQTVVVGNDLHSTAFQVQGVEEINNATALHFGDIPMFVGLGKVSDVNMNSLTTSTELGGWQVDGGKHEGRRLVDFQKENSYLIQGFNGSKFEFGRQLPLQDHFSRTGANKNQFWIAETGAGDSWRIPTTISIEKKMDADGGLAGFHLDLNIPARLQLPVKAGTRKNWVYLNSNGKWETLDVRYRNKFIEFEISPASLKNGKTVIKATYKN